MREQTVAMYCVLDDLRLSARPTWVRTANPQRRLSDAQVLTAAFVAAHFFGSNLLQVEHYLKQYRLDKSGFTRQLHSLTDALLGLFATFDDLHKHLHTEAYYVVDSFPKGVCHDAHILRRKILTGKAHYGRCASKRRWFYGSKVQVLTTSAGVPVAFYVHAGRAADSTGLRGLALDLAASSVLTPMPATPATWQ